MRAVELGSAMLLVGALVCVATFARPQSSETYKVRLTTVPIDASMMARVTGTGSLSAVLTGSKLMISGNFSGMRSPATEANIHRGAKGVRGPAIRPVHLTMQASATANRYQGEIHDSVDLDAGELNDLRNARLYIQINSEGAPEGNLWGWVLR